MKKLSLILIYTMFAFFGVAQQKAATNAKTSTNAKAAAETEAATNASATTSADTNGGLVIAKLPDQIYTGVAFTPELVIKDGNKALLKNMDYTLTYANNVNVGIATVTIIGKGNYQGTTTVMFQITPKSINTVGINPIADQTYRSMAIMPEVLIRDGNRPLIRDVDYTLAYINNVNVGSATVNITGKGNYKDTKSMMFRINPKSFGGGAMAPGSRQAATANQNAAAATATSTTTPAATTTTATPAPATSTSTPTTTTKSGTGTTTKK